MRAKAQLTELSIANERGGRPRFFAYVKLLETRSLNDYCKRLERL